MIMKIIIIIIIIIIITIVITMITIMITIIAQAAKAGQQAQQAVGWRPTMSLRAVGSWRSWRRRQLAQMGNLIAPCTHV